MYYDTSCGRFFVPPEKLEIIKANLQDTQFLSDIVAARDLDGISDEDYVDFFIIMCLEEFLIDDQIQKQY